MTHPCDGHDCDHCYLCDVVGICCATVPAAASSSSADLRPEDTLRQDIRDEAADSIGLSQLIQIEVSVQLSPSSAPAALPPGTEPTNTLYKLLGKDSHSEPAA